VDEALATSVEVHESERNHYKENEFEGIRHGRYLSAQYNARKD
jgi:hypothetical protein